MLVVNKIDDIESDNELIKKLTKSKTRKIFKLEKSKSKKLSKSQKLAKSEKKLSKSGNLPNFKAKKNEPSFLTSKAKIIFHHL